MSGNLKADGPTCSRWAAVCVDTLDHSVLDHGPYDRRSAWLWLIFNATWKDKTVNHKGRPLDLKRGQVIAGRAFLAQKWGWSEKQVRLFLGRLVSEGMLEKGQSSGHYANVVTITNYDIYQHQTNQERPEQGPVQGQCGASAGPVQGQTLTSTTLTVNENTSAKPEAQPNESDAGHGVIVNCETIRHPAFTISLPAIKMGTLASGRTAEQVKTECIAHALQWAVEIEAGKPARDVVPSKIVNFLSASIMGTKVRSDVAEVRKSKAETAAKPYRSVHPSDIPHAVSADTIRYAKPAKYEF